MKATSWVRTSDRGGRASTTTTRTSRRIVALAALLGAGAVLAAVSSQMVVAGNLISMVVTLGLFYSTINLHQDKVAAESQ